MTARSRATLRPDVYPRRVMSSGWFFLAAMIGAYGVANLLQSMAAARTTVHDTLDPKLLVRLARHRTYLVGLGCQILGFVLAFLARRDLPLFLVQASVAAGLGVTAVLGVLMLKWRLPRAEIVLLALLVRRHRPPGRLGRTAPVPAARAWPAIIGAGRRAGRASAVAGFFAARLTGAPGSVALGALAGIAFGAAAVAVPAAGQRALGRRVRHQTRCSTC